MTRPWRLALIALAETAAGAAIVLAFTTPPLAAGLAAAVAFNAAVLAWAASATPSDDRGES